MSTYQKLGGALGITAPAAGSIASTDLTTSITGSRNVAFVKVTNTNLSGAITLSFQTSTALTGDSAATIVGAGQTEYVQVAPLNNTGPVYFYIGGTAGAVAYITPVAIVD
jgi:hypothetical protein